MFRIVSFRPCFSAQLLHTSRISNSIEIFRNPPKMYQYYSQACDGIFKEYGISMFPEDITYWSRGFHELFAYMAVDKDTDKLISCCIGGLDEESAAGEKLATGGCFYTDPKYRGSGISKQVLRQCFSHFQDYNTGGHGVLVEKNGTTSCDKYSKMGYNLHQPHTLLKVAIKVNDLDLQNQEKTLISKDFSEVNWASIFEYDDTVSVRKRSNYMRLRLEPNEYTVTKVILDAKNGQVQGVCSFRITRTGDLQAGPFYCDNEMAAYQAVKDVLNTVQLKEGSQLIFHYPSCNQSAARFFKMISNGRLSCKPYAQQQFNKKLIHHNWDKVYSVTDTTLSLV